MILIKRKKLILILICLSLMTILFLNRAGPQTISTSSTPVSNHVVILDAGHGFPDGGAEAQDGTFESSINLSITQKLQKLLEASSCTVILTRSDENGIYDLNSKSIREKKVSDMKNRAQIGNTSNAEIFISIHLNKISSSKYSGWQVFYQSNDENSLNLASCLQEGLNNSIQKENKRKISKSPDIYLSKNLEIPFVIAECGFLSNQEECDLLKTDEYQDRLAWGIYIGIMDYFNN